MEQGRTPRRGKKGHTYTYNYDNDGPQSQTRWRHEDPYARKQLDYETERIHVPNYEVPYAQK